MGHHLCFSGTMTLPESPQLPHLPNGNDRDVGKVKDYAHDDALYTGKAGAGVGSLVSVAACVMSCMWSLCKVRDPFFLDPPRRDLTWPDIGSVQPAQPLRWVTVLLGLC